MTVPFRIDLAGKVAVVTGGGGVLCSRMAQALAECGAKVAVLDLDLDAAEAVAAALRADGLSARGFTANVLERPSLESAAELIRAEFGPCDLLLNGAGGNHPGGTTSKEWLDAADLDEPSLTTFFDLDPQNIQRVFNLNFLGTLIPSQVFARQMVGKLPPQYRRTSGGNTGAIAGQSPVTFPSYAWR